MLSTKEYVLILGAGQTGISAAKFLKKIILKFLIQEN